MKTSNTKSKKCFVGVFNKKGDCFQVALDDKKQDMVLNFLSQFFEGSINVLSGKIPIELEIRQEKE